jgi:hypothetical protein
MIPPNKEYIRYAKWGERGRLWRAFGGMLIIWAYGYPTNTFRVAEDGLYRLEFQAQVTQTGLKSYGVSIVQDTVTGNEAKFVWSIWLQLLIIVGILVGLSVRWYLVPFVRVRFYSPVNQESRLDVVGRILQEEREK